MKNQSSRIPLFLLLSILTSLMIIINACSYVTGETPASGTLPGWVWSAGDGGYSIIVDRYTHEPIRDVSPDEAFGIMFSSSHSENPVILDVRTPQEYSEGHIRDAVIIDYRGADFRDKIGQLNKDKQYVVYCRTGVRSSAARDIMEEMGFKHVINMTGGYVDWLAAGLPVTQ